MLKKIGCHGCLVLAGCLLILGYAAVSHIMNEMQTQSMRCYGLKRVREQIYRKSQETVMSKPAAFYLDALSHGALHVYDPCAEGMHFSCNDEGIVVACYVDPDTHRAVIFAGGAFLDPQSTAWAGERFTDSTTCDNLRPR